MSTNQELIHSVPSHYTDPAFEWPTRRWAVFHNDRAVAVLVARRWTRRGALNRSSTLQILNHRHSGSPGRFAVGRVR